MPPKKIRDKGPPERDYELLTLEEVKAREQKYTSHIMELGTCLNIIDEVISSVAELDENQLIANKWQDFVTCNPLPKPYKPADVRLFMAKLKSFEDVNIRKNIDWTLSIDEHSILSQNIFRKDLTRRTLDHTIKSNFGYKYNEHIGDCINVLRRLQYFLDNEIEVSKCSRNVLEDIKQLKITIQEEINVFLDRYTYRILCGEDAYMKEPRLIANLHEIKVTLHIPSFMLQQNLSIRAIHMNFDYISEYAKSFSQDDTENLNVGIQNLPECLLNEWLMQLDIQTRIRNSMIQKRLEYEEKLRLFEEAEAKKKGKKAIETVEKSGKIKKTKLKKPTKEPTLVESDVYPNIWMDFLTEEQEQYGKFINTVYNPNSLGLDSDEINLKKFFILGGIYQLYNVQKLKHWDFNTFNMTWHEDEAKLVIDKNMQISNLSQYLGRRSTRVFQRLTARALSLKIDAEKESTDPECPWFVLTIQLPEYLCYWGEPIACHYETITSIIEETTQVEPTLPELVKKKTKKDQVQILTTLQPEHKNEPPPASDPEFLPFLEPQQDDLRSSVLKIRRISKIPYQTNSFISSLMRLSQSQNGVLHAARDAEGVLNVKDFEMSPLLNKLQIRHIERHLLPHIISSFKFPKELREDELKAIQNQSKTKGGTLIRKPANKEIDLTDETHRILTYSHKQNNPERMFAIYTPEEPMRLIQPLHNNDKEVREPLTFSQLVNIVNNIKKCYKLRVRKTLDVQPYKPGFELENKRLKEQHKAKLMEAIPSFGTIPNKSGSNIRLKSKLDKKDQDDAGVDIGELTTETSIKESSSETQVFEHKQIREILVQKSETKTITYSHWTTQHILKSEYDKAKCTITLQTDRLGYIGFAFKRYEHFPFRYWKLEPSESDPENEVVFTLETQCVRCIFYITDNGIRGHVTEPTKTFKRNPKMYLVIDKPMKDYTEFKKLFIENNLNIFADHDASFYIENGYFSEKHLATEMHTYNCMAINCTQMKFQFSQWNRLAQRRDIILQFVQYMDLPENIVEVRITPEEAFYVEISELCSDDMDIIKLQYNLTWRNINTYSDLHHLINSMYPAATDLRCKNPKLINFIRNLLNEIRPLSFS